MGARTRPEVIRLAPVDSLSVTILVDNVTDLLAVDEVARRASMLSTPTARVPGALLEGGEAIEGLRAEHGFSALVTVETGGRRNDVLFDTGISRDGLVENMARLDLSPRDIEAIVLSHGHFDHTTGMEGLSRALGPRNLPVLIHPEFWSRRRLAMPGRDAVEIPTTSRPALVGAGFEVVEGRRPSFLLGGSLLVTGEVDRTTGFERGFPTHQARREGGWEPDPLILDDQALVARVRDRGLVVITGCGHAGIVNTVRYASRLTGEDRIHAIIGGFHLGGRLFEPIIGDTCDALAELDPDVLVPCHCTGWRATMEIARRFPDAFLQNTVGTRFALEAPAG